MTLDIGPELRPGSVLPGGYRIEDRLGSGGMGVVYKAVHEESGTPVAVKVLRPGETDRRFREEGRVLAAVRHPGLVTVLDEGQHGEQPFLVLAYVPGPTLRQLLELGPLRPDEVARLGTELARTLAHVHAHDVVHRDVKPSNILIAEDGRPLLNDFGVSYRAGRTRWTQSGFVNGTAAYLAPEQVLGEPPAAPIDVYALGLVLIECLSGFPEYDGTAIECAVARLHRTPRRPEDAPDWLADVLMAMTAAKPEDRPTAAETAELLAGRGSLPTVAPAGRSRARTALLAGAATVAAAGVVAAVWLPQSTPASTSGEPLSGQVAPVAVAPPAGTTHGTSGKTVAPTATGPGAVVDRVTEHPPASPTKAAPPAKATAPPAKAAAPAAPDPEQGKAKGHGKGKGKGTGGPGKGQRSA